MSENSKLCLIQNLYKLLDLRIKTMKKEILKNLISDFTFLRIDSQGNSTDSKPLQLQNF